MCGINGFTHKDDGQLLQMMQKTEHRGRDGSGTYCTPELSLGHNLLAITETPALGKQPMHSSDGRYVLAYNGEVYNYAELKKDLIRDGEQFSTNGDTEVLLKGLARYGQKYLERLDGMFAVAFYDNKTSELTLARDRYGMKPMYITRSQDHWVFSSEVRALLQYGVPALLDIESSKTFFVLGYVPGSKTLFRNIEKLCPGEIRKINVRTQSVETDRIESRELKISDQAQLRDILGRSTVAHTMGLRPFGLFLSGGLDSTALLHELKQNDPSLINTFSTRFETNDDRYNEDADLAKKLSHTYNINHHELLITQSNFIDAVPKVISAMEEPRYNHSTPAYWLLMQEAAKSIVVVLDGSGGDELFGGYPKYLNGKNIRSRYDRYPKMLIDIGYSYKLWKEHMLRTGEYSTLKDPLSRWVYMNKIIAPVNNSALPFMSDHDINDVTHFLKKHAFDWVPTLPDDPEEALMQLDRSFWLADEDFIRADKIAMHFGVEGRYPFLGDEVVAFARQIPAKEKLFPQLKNPIRHAYQGILPQYITEKKKTGWNAPFALWMNGLLGDMVRETLTNDYYPETSTLFNFSQLRAETIDSVEEFSLSSIKKFLPIFYFQIWAKEFGIRL